MAEGKNVFEKIRDREIPAEILYEDDDCLCFRDISPQAPEHLLLVPKRVIPRLTAATGSDGALLGNLLLASAKVARALGFEESGYRVVINNGPDAGEEIPHLHLHLLARRRLTWPPG